MENQIKEVYVVQLEALDDGVPYTHIELYTNADAAYRACCALIEEEKGLHPRAFDEDGEYIYRAVGNILVGKLYAFGADLLGEARFIFADLALYSPHRSINGCKHV